MAHSFLSSFIVDFEVKKQGFFKTQRLFWLYPGNFFYQIPGGEFICG